MRPVRAVARLEERWVLGGLTDRDVIGIAGFVDAGRVWAGDAAFGVDSGTELGIGFGLLAALPAESQRLWRIDVAVPLGTELPARWGVRFSGTWAIPSWREPRDIARVRAGASASTIFGWR